MTAKTILIVEDDALLQDSLQVYLTAQHFRVLQAGNVGEAHTILRIDPPDIVLLDLLLPGENGITLLKSLHEEKSRIPVIVITNTDSVGRRQECMELGARDFIIKSDTSLTVIGELIVKHCGNAAS